MGRSGQTWRRATDRRLSLAAGLLLLAGAAGGATITVTGTGDANAVDGVVTLREAILSINAGSNVNADVVAVGSYGTGDTILFAIPGAGVHTITPGAALPAITKPVTIDGYSQPGSAQNKLADGDDAVLLVALDGSGVVNGNLLDIRGGNSTVKGLVLGGMSNGNGLAISLLAGNTGNTIAGNFIGTDWTGSAKKPNSVGIYVLTAQNTIGGSTPQDRNVISGNDTYGIEIVSAASTRIVGNFIGTDHTGTLALTNRGYGLSLANCTNTTIGGVTPAERNLISGNNDPGVGIGLHIAGGSGQAVLGNYIGTDAKGLSPVGNRVGIDVNGTTAVIGSPGAGNVVSGNATVGLGIQTAAGCANPCVLVQGNYIGTNAAGAPLPNLGDGIQSGGPGVVIGGPSLSVANAIWGNVQRGIDIGSGSTTIRGNSIFGNGLLGISLGGGGVILNDPCDADSGPNNLQNFPVITSATSNGSTTTVVGTLNSTASTAFDLDFFASPTCDPSGYGQGQLYLGSTTVTTNASCDAAINAVLPLSAPNGWAVTSTATDPTGNTSGFSQCLTAVGVCPAIMVTNPGVMDGTVGTFFSQTFTRVGGTAPVTFSIASGFLPTGLNLTTSGTLAGNPTQKGPFPIRVKVTDANACTGISQDYSLFINCQAISVSNPMIATGTVGTFFNQTFTQTGAIGSATFSLASGSLPSGLSLSAAGVLSGTPTQSGTFVITVKVTDANGCSVPGQPYSLQIGAGCPTIDISPATLPDGLVGISYFERLSGAGGQAPYSFAVISGAPPQGLTLQADGAVIGSPTQAGSSSFTARATDANGCAGSRAYTIAVGIPCTETAAPTGLSLTIDTSKRFNMPYTLDWTPLSGYSGDYVLETTSDDPLVGTTSALVSGHTYRGTLFHAPPRNGRYTYYFTVRTSCTLSRTSDPVTLVQTGSPATRLRALRDLTQIAIWEQTNLTPLQPHTFGRDDRELHDVFLDRMVGGPPDFVGGYGDFYDIYYSDADGTENYDGGYLTIESNHLEHAPAEGGLNIAEVYYYFGPGEIDQPDFVASFFASGDNARGAIDFGIDGNTATHTAYGNNLQTAGRYWVPLRMTLGYTVATATICQSASPPALSIDRTFAKNEEVVELYWTQTLNGPGRYEIYQSNNGGLSQLIADIPSAGTADPNAPPLAHYFTVKAPAGRQDYRVIAVPACRPDLPVGSNTVSLTVTVTAGINLAVRIIPLLKDPGAPDYQNFRLDYENKGGSDASDVYLRVTTSFVDSSTGTTVTSDLVTLTVGQMIAPSAGSTPPLRARAGEFGVDMTIKARIGLGDHVETGSDIYPADNEDQFVVGPDIDCIGQGPNFKPCPLTWWFNCNASPASLIQRVVEGVRRAVATLADAVSNLQTFYGIRDRVLAASPVGRRYIGLYEEHRAEITSLLIADSSLRGLAAAAIQAWEPRLRAVLDGGGASLTFTPEMASSMNSLLEALKSKGGAALRADIVAEQRLVDLSSWIGLSLEQAVRKLDQQPCIASDTALCLNGGRFKVEASWKKTDGTTGPGHASVLTGDSGTFWFFDAANIEIVVKALNGCGADARWWVFAGGLTNVEVTLTVTDTHTGDVKTYVNPQGAAFAPILDTQAFASCSAAASLAPDPEAPSAKTPRGRRETAAAPGAPCAPGTTALCLDGGRFRAEAVWTTADGQTGSAQAVSLTADSGYFWFFDPGNVEMLVKVLNGCSVDARRWVFAGGLTNVKVVLTVTDTQTGAVRRYENPQGSAFLPIQDTAAFTACP